MARGVSLLTRRARHLVRTAVVYALYYAGVLRLVQRVRLRGRAVVLMYHRVLTPAQQAQTGSHPGIIVSRETFARHMAIVKRHFTVLSTEEFAARAQMCAPFPDSSCLITFDDGWRDNVENALPILETEGLPALIFLPVNFIGTDRVFWRETLTLLLARAVREARHRPQRREALRALLEPVGLAAVLDMPHDDPRAAVSDALAPLKAAPTTVPEDLIARLRTELVPTGDASAPVDGFMDWTQVATLRRRRVEVGGHGAEHRLLNQISESEADAEIATARAVIGERAAPHVAAFSYPNGSVTPAIAAKVRQAGFALAFTTETGLVAAGDDPYMLRRVNISEDVTRTGPLFLARVIGLI